MLSLNFALIEPDRNFCINANVSEEQALVLYTILSAIPIINISNAEKLVVRKCLVGDKAVLPIQHQLWKSLHLISITAILLH